jgi:CMP-N-acetylneuraminic acid synthetase
MKKITMLLPMKGHSERVSNKNLKLFCNKPLYHAVANVLLKSKYISEVIINTDSIHIKEDVKENFPSFIINDRPAELIGDMVSMNEIINFDLESSDSTIFVQTHSTNPILLTETLDNAIEHFLNNEDKYDSVFSVTRLQTRLYWENGAPINHNPQELIRTQDLPPVMEENSSFYIFTKESFKTSGKKRIGNNPLLFEIDKIEAIDIDDPQDFIIAEQLYKLLRIQK